MTIKLQVVQTLSTGEFRDLVSSIYGRQKADPDSKLDIEIECNVVSTAKITGTHWSIN